MYRNIMRDIYNASGWILMSWMMLTINQILSASPRALQIKEDSYDEMPCLRNATVNEISKLNKSATFLCIINSYLPNITEDTLSDFTNLTEFVFANNLLATLSPHAFSGLHNLIKLDLTNNRISSLPSSVFFSTRNLEVLSLKRNQVNGTDAILSTLSLLPLLRSLDLSENNLESLETRNFQFSRLEILRLQNCQLHRFEAWSFPSLKKLYLTNNILTAQSLDLSALNNSVTLQELHLGNIQTEQTDESSVYNYFPEIGNNFLSYFPNMSLLDLQNCDVAFIDSSAFDAVPKLETLILRSNKLPTVPKSVTSLKQLRFLDMSYNGKREMTFRLGSVDFTSMTSLNVLKLAHTEISTLKANDFFGLRNLTSLSLKDTSLSKIEPYAFRSLNSLLFLDLSNNELTEIINDTFADLSSLIHLKLSYNILKIYPRNHPFLPTLSLKVLEFQYNSLCELWDHLIPHLSNLTSIDMSHNKIVQWKWNAFPTSGSLKRANFDDNEISAITKPMLHDLLTLESGMFSENPYNCTDCDIANVQELLKSPIYSKDAARYRCSYKASQEGGFVVNVTLPTSCDTVGYNYVVAGIGAGLLLLTVLFVAGISFYHRWYIRYRWFVARCHLKNWHKPLQSKQSRLYDAFISYSEKDRYWVENEFLLKLESKFRFCVHDRDFEPGRNITENIFDGIDKSKMFIAVLTEDFLGSQWCMWEMNMAISKMAIEQSNNLVIIKLHMISKDKLTRPIQYLMKAKTYLIWPVTPTGQRLFWERLTHVLEKCGGTANPV